VEGYRDTATASITVRPRTAASLWRELKSEPAPVVRKWLAMRAAAVTSRDLGEFGRRLEWLPSKMPREFRPFPSE